MSRHLSIPWGHDLRRRGNRLLRRLLDEPMARLRHRLVPATRGAPPGAALPSAGARVAHGQEDGRSSAGLCAAPCCPTCGSGPRHDLLAQVPLPPEPFAGAVAPPPPPDLHAEPPDVISLTARAAHMGRTGQTGAGQPETARALGLPGLPVIGAAYRTPPSTGGGRARPAAAGAVLQFPTGRMLRT